MRRRVIGSLCAALAIAALQATIVHASPSARSAENTLAALHNRDRAAFGRPALARSPHLDMVARNHAARMANASRIWHDPALPGTVAGWKYLGDNVGRSNAIHHLHAGFMASAKHRENLLFWEYEQFGVGAVYARDGRVYAAVVFVTPSRGAVVKIAATTAAPVRAATPLPVQTIGMLVRLVALDA